MKVGTFLLIGSALFLTFKAGEFVGYIDGRRDTSKKRKHYVYDADGKILEVAFRRFKFTVFEPVTNDKTVKGEAQ